MEPESRSFTECVPEPILVNKATWAGVLPATVRVGLAGRAIGTVTDEGGAVPSRGSGSASCGAQTPTDAASLGSVAGCSGFVCDAGAEA